MLYLSQLSIGIKSSGSSLDKFPVLKFHTIFAQDDEY